MRKVSSGAGNVGRFEMTNRVGVEPEELTRICQEYDIAYLGLFGSALNEDFGPDSDIDLLVSFESGTRVGLIEFAGIQRELSTLFGREVDLVPANSLKPSLRDEVLASAETLHAS